MPTSNNHPHQNHRPNPLRRGLDIPQQRRVGFPTPKRAIQHAVEGDIIGEMGDAEPQRGRGEECVVEHEAGGDGVVVMQNAAVLRDVSGNDEDTDEADVRVSWRLWGCCKRRGAYDSRTVRLGDVMGLRARF